MNTFNTFRALDERTMTTKEKAKEDRLKDKYDNSSMKKNMKDHYGKEEGEKVYYATIRKQAMKNEHHQKDADGKVIEHEDEAPGTPASVEEAAQPAGQVPDKRAEALKKRQSMIKKQVLMKKLQALRQGGGEDVVAHNELEGEMVEGVGDALKKGVKRHKDAVEKKKIKNRKAVPYAALAAEHEPEGEELKEYSPNVTYQAKGGKKSGKLGKSSVYSLRDKDESKKEFRKSQVKDIKGGYLKTEEKKKGLDGKECWDGYKLAGTKKKGGKTVDNCVKVKEDYYSGTGEKVQKRTLAWMKKKGQKGAPGLDAMKAREAEHKAKRGVKEEVVDEAKVEKNRSDYGKASVRNKRKFGKEGEPAIFDTNSERGKMIDQRRAEHKARRGVKEDWKPEIEHSKLGDAKKKADKKRESKLPPHLQGDAIGKMKKAFSQEGYRVLASSDGQEKPSQFSYKDEKTAKKYVDSIKKGGGKATIVKEDIGSFKDYMANVEAAKKRQKDKEENRKRKSDAYIERVRKGIKFYDAKGSGRMVKGKKVYDKK